MEIGYRIADVAARTGFNASALRYYEDIGLLAAPSRTDAGYRVYDEDAVTRLRFIARAKQLGCTLDEIRELVRAWEGDQCAPVVEQLRALVDAKVADTADRIDELRAFRDQLRDAAASLAAVNSEGRCDDDCACMAPSRVDSRRRSTVTAVPIACTLPDDAMPTRLADWQRVLAPVTARTAIDGGVRLTFGDDVDVVELTRLMHAEQGCCRFFGFALTIDADGVGLEVRAPADAQDVVTSLFGAPA